jgi:hypothetical protein
MLWEPHQPIQSNSQIRAAYSCASPYGEGGGLAGWGGDTDRCGDLVYGVSSGAGACRRAWAGGGGWHGRVGWYSGGCGAEALVCRVWRVDGSGLRNADRGGQECAGDGSADRGGVGGWGGRDGIGRRQEVPTVSLFVPSCATQSSYQASKSSYQVSKSSYQDLILVSPGVKPPFWLRSLSGE